MDLLSGTPYWLFKSPMLHTYTALNKNCKSDVTVIGGGISGALACYALLQAGCRVMLVTSGHVGTGSTCASTSLLQYEIDTPLYQLAQKLGTAAAIQAYISCCNSINELKKIHEAIKCPAFKRRKSLLLASQPAHADGLEQEFIARHNIGLKVQWLGEKQLQHQFGITAPAGIYSQQGAVTDSYLFTQQLVAWCAANGATVFDKTGIKAIKHHRNSIELVTSTGYKITSRYAVMAGGYQAGEWTGLNLCRLHSTFVIISEPFKKKDLWKDQCLIWETARPYTYFRTTHDKRIIVGGKDVPHTNDKKRSAQIPAKSRQLIREFNKKFPGLNFNIEYAWAGTFAETADGLPYIGCLPRQPRLFYALGYGGNGITFSQVAAQIIAGAITGKKNPDAAIFSFNRLHKAI